MHMTVIHHYLRGMEQCKYKKVIPEEFEMSEDSANGQHMRVYTNHRKSCSSRRSLCTYFAIAIGIITFSLNVLEYVKMEVEIREQRKNLTLISGKLDSLQQEMTSREYQNLNSKHIVAGDMKVQDASKPSLSGVEYLKREIELLKEKIDLPVNIFEHCEIEKDKCHISSKGNYWKACPTRFFPKDVPVSLDTVTYIQLH